MKSFEYIFISIMVTLAIASALTGYFQINFMYVIIFGFAPSILFVIYILNQDEIQSIEGVQHETY